MKKTFDQSTLNAKDKQILDDFKQRREIFSHYIEDKKLAILDCPSCGYPTLNERGGYDICLICDWEDDNQDDETADEIWGGPNGSLSLTESRLIIGRDLNEKLTPSSKLIMDPEKVIKIIDGHNNSKKASAEEARKINATQGQFKTERETILNSLVD